MFKGKELSVDIKWFWLGSFFTHFIFFIARMIDGYSFLDNLLTSLISIILTFTITYIIVSWVERND